MHHLMRQINYWWRRDSGLPIPQEHIELLEKVAEQRIYLSHYTGGELIHFIGDDEYRGRWSITQGE